MTIEIPEGIPTVIFDYFHQGEIPTFVLCNPNKEQLYALGGISERAYSAKFNAFSELSFRADEYVSGTYMEYYDYLTYRRLIYVDTIGYFMISEVSQMSDGIVRYKEVTCQALEVELSSKRLVVYQSGSTVMVSGSPVPPPNPIKLNQLLEELEDKNIPDWTHATIPASISEKYRSFDIADKTVYDFLMTEVEDSYGCVFDFDTVNKIINTYDPNVAISETDIYISHNNVINELTVDEVVDELATCLNVYGGGGMDIRWVNPLGNNNIYDLSYFETTEWMTQSLIDSINIWESAIESASPIYSASAQVLIEWYDYISASTAIYTNKSGSRAVLEELRTIAMTTTYGDPLWWAGEVAKLTARIDILTIEINAIDAQITSGCNLVDYTLDSMHVLAETLSFRESFTETEIGKLQPFIIESSYVNANIILTDSMSASNVIIYSEQLYNSASAVLEKTSHPKYTFEVNSVNFMQIEAFQKFRDQLCLGCSITIAVSDSQDIEAILLGMDMNFDDPTDFALVFGNRLRMDDESLKFTDLMGKAINAGNANKIYSQQWNNWSNNYKNNVTNFIASPIDASTNTVTNSGSNLEITLTGAGLKARQKLSIAESYENTGYSGSQMYIAANCILITQDNWKTFSRLIGGQTIYYGLNLHLDDILDCEVPTPADGDSLVYDEATNMWVNEPVLGGGCFVCDDTNTYGGAGALDSHTSGTKNTAIGHDALTALTDGEQNTAVGYNTLSHITSAEGNTAIGGSALHKTTSGDFNTAIGIGALEENTLGYSNVAIGDYALRSNTTGDYNVAIGEAAMGSITGDDNVAVGDGAMADTKTGDDNVALGNSAMQYMQKGYDNIAIGNQALFFNDGEDNIAIGHQAMVNSHTGSYNIAIGLRSMYNTNNTYNNIGIGFQTLYNNLAHYNIAIGGSAMEHNTTGQYNVAIGMRASKYNQTGESNVAVGWDALHKNETSGNTAIGFNTMVDNITGIENTAVGAWALQYNLGNFNTAVGAAALYYTNGSRSTSIGAYSLTYDQDGNDNVAIGYQSLGKTNGGNGNVAIGVSTLFQSTQSIHNIAIGFEAIAYGNGEKDSVAVGYQALNSSRGQQNVGVGAYSCFYNTHGELNVAIGEQSMYYNLTGQMNTAVGQTSLHDNQWGDENTAVGLGALEKMDAFGTAIIAFSNYSGTVAGTVKVTTDGAHGLPTGTTTLINIKATTNYNHSSITVTRIDATNFYFTHAWAGDDATGYWYHGHSGYMNTAIGAESGFNTGSGAYNVFVGAKADSTINTNNSIAIGHEAYVTKSNQIMLGNSSITETVLNGHVILANTDWDDLRVPITSVKLAGVKDPGFAVFKTNGGGSTGVYTYWFDNNTEEEVFFACQMPHQWKEGTTIHPHVHWTPKTNGTTSASRVCWGLEYTWSNITGSFGNTTISYNNIPVDYSGSPIADNHYLTELPDITASGKTFSSMLICRLFRDATSSGSSDSYAYDAGLLEFDFHYEIDSFGSQDEFLK